MLRPVLVEALKVRRSAVVWTATVLLVVLLPALGLGLYSVALRGGAGPLALKAQAFLVEGGWRGYLALVDQIVAVAMFLGAGIVVAWAFGREHADHTFPSLFALPVSRASIAGAKFLVLLAWMAIVSLLVAGTALVLGLVAGIDDPVLSVVGPALARLFVVASTSAALSIPVALVASAGRGYLPAVGALILLVAAAQVSVLFGTGAWFPFAVPGLLAISGSEGAPVLAPVHLALVPATAALGVWLTLRWWRLAEAV